MRPAAASLPEQLARVPNDRVVHLAGASADDVVGGLTRSDTLPAAIVLPSMACASIPAFVTGVLDALDVVARQLVPAWLPEIDQFDTPQGAARAAARAAATARARNSGLSTMFLADLAERALTGRPSSARLRPEARVVGLSRILAIGFRRDRVIIVTPAGTEMATSGLSWLADRGRLGVWLVGGDRPGIERVVTVHLDLPPVEARSIGSVVGRPHPRSTVEAALEAVLARQSWAYGRIWNGTYRSSSIRSAIRPDLVWPAERVVVELDGLEHCRPDQYDADRVRDVHLQLDGYAVLRFTNARVRHDVQAVASQIGNLIQSRRQDVLRGNKGD